MAHEISEVMIGGKRIVEAMYAKDPAWHGLGTVIPDAQNSEITMEKSHLGWLVGKKAMVLKDGGEDVEKFFALVREDNRKTLAVVGSDYVPLQNHEAFKFLDELMKDGIIKYESAFALKGGKHVCLTARMPSVDTVVPGDDSLRYIFFSNTHGGGGIDITPTSVRVVCANTKRMALEEGRKRKTTFTIRHSGNMTAKLNEAHRFMSQFDKMFTDFREGAKALLVGFNKTQQDAYLDTLFGQVDKDATDRVKANHQAKIDNVAKALLSPAQQITGVKGTWWSLFNAVTEAVDHAEKLRKVSDMTARRENRYLDIISGPGATFKDLAFDTALAMAS